MQDLRHQPEVEIVPDAPTEPEAFLRWAAMRPREEGKYELSRGVVFRTMINVTWGHSQLVTNLVLELGRSIDLDSYDIAATDFGIRTPYSVRGPDIAVLPRGTDDTALSADNPVMIAEVLSPSTEKIDFNDKREEYGAIPTLQTYLIFSKEEPKAWRFDRLASGRLSKKAKIIADIAAKIALPHLDAALSMKRIYRHLAGRK